MYSNETLCCSIRGGSAALAWYKSFDFKTLGTPATSSLRGCKEASTEPAQLWVCEGHLAQSVQVTLHFIRTQKCYPRHMVLRPLINIELPWFPALCFDRCLSFGDFSIDPLLCLGPRHTVGGVFLRVGYPGFVFALLRIGLPVSGSKWLRRGPVIWKAKSKKNKMQTLFGLWSYKIYVMISMLNLWQNVRGQQTMLLDS